MDFWSVVGQGRFHSFFFLSAAAVLALKRKLSLPVSRMWQRWVSRSSKAVVILGSPKTVARPFRRREPGLYRVGLQMLLDGVARHASVALDLPDRQALPQPKPPDHVQ